MAIIGISGKMGSGKDTVGSIIQYLTCDHGKNKTRTFEECNGKIDSEGMGYADFTRYNSEWQVKKFATKLKEFVASLTGCTVEQLENQVFKASYVPKEWEYIYGYNDKIITRVLPEDDFSPERIKRYTYRDMLQYIGTELMRDQLHANTWTNALFSDYKNINPGPTREVIYPNWLITDLRFPNELKAIKDRGGVTIRIQRGITDPSIKLHYSETALDNCTFDHVIDNNGTIKELIDKVSIIYYSIIEKTCKAENKV